MFSLIYARINDWVNNREAGDLRRHRGHYDVIVMLSDCFVFKIVHSIWWFQCAFIQDIPLEFVFHWGLLRINVKMASISQTTFSNAFFFNEKVLILIRTSLKRVPKSSVDNKSALVQIIGLEPMLVYLTDACVTRLHWVTMLLYMMSLITYHHILQYRTLKTWLVIILALFLLIYFKEKNVVLNTLSHDDLHPMLCADSPPVWPHWCVRNPQWPVRRAAGMLYTHRQISQKS